MTNHSEPSLSTSPASLGVIGAGTMGAGIAQVASMAGWKVELMDVDEKVVQAAIEGIAKRLNRLVEKERLTPAARDEAVSRLLVATSPDCFRECDLVIEAIVEDLDVKAKVLGGIVPSLRDDAIIATNTSSLSVSRIAQALGEPYQSRTCGMHFFNPAPLMKLCEVIAGDQTSPEVVNRVTQIAQSWGKQVARAADVPGFIVNHVARPYYLEAFRILEDGYARPDDVDNAMKSLGGFRMGPLELTDLIGQDVNTATTRSVWEQLDKPPLLHPSALQESLAQAGHLGRKTKRGVYDYTTETPTPSIDTKAFPFEMSEALREAVNNFVTRAVDRPGDELQNYIFARIVGALIVQATLAFERGVAQRDDIDIAMKYGVNYPHGPFEWVTQIGTDKVMSLLDALNETVDDNRFAPPESLRVPV
ncbi:MAG: 3-hydroxyacyl-CoA dehydrogenase NAD-binding domain-containing protein [Planctomycetota bacterium]|nr:3-hydroxyacyl-CoA dehydrogenase NAD-binding domain-containing protein [Planctomycetota bacterium]